MKKYLLIFICFLAITNLTNAQNNALDFDGTGDNVSCGTFNLSGSSFTYECWFKVDAFQTVDPFISSLMGFDNDPNIAILRIVNDKIQFVWYELGFSTFALTGTTVLQTDEWYHVAGVFDDNGAGLATANVYLNGILEVTATGMTATNVSNSPFYLSYSNGGRYLNGQMDEVRVWKGVARTQAEVRANMYTELNGDETGLFAYYKLNETTGTIADDSQTSSSYDGTLTGTGFSFDNNAFPSPAFFGPKNCLDFDGIDDHVNFSNHHQFTDPITIEVWIKTTSTAAINEIISWGKSSASQNVQIRTNNNGKFEFGMDPDVGDWKSVLSTQSVNTGDWVHLAVVKNSTTVTLYINGVEDGTGTVYAGAGGVDKFEIGKYWDIGNFFTGSIDEVRLWSDVRSVQEIRENMYKILTGSESGLAAYYNFDNVAGTTLQDFGPSAYDGALQNMATEDWAASTTFNNWLNTNSTSWTTAANWSLGSLPGSSDNVCIDDQSGSSPALSGTPTVNNLVVGSSAGMTLSSGFTVNGNLILNDGIDLNGKTITLGSSATLYEDNGLFSGSTGTITTTRGVANPNSENIGGLGATITDTDQDLGSTTIVRGHSTTGINGLDRYFQITTASSPTSATLVFSYDNSELNNQTEASLKLYKSSDGSTWSDESSSTVDEGNNTLTLTGINAFSYWTGAYDRAPTVTTQAVSSITKYTATGNGNVTELGITNPTEHGVCWSTSTGPTTSDSKTTDGSVSATGAFTSFISGLSTNTTYYVKAYATNATGTAYGEQVSFTSMTLADNYSVQTGNWNTASTWNSGVPTGGQSIDIISGHVVTLDVSISASGISLYVENGATLTYDGGTRDLVIKTDGYFKIYGIVNVYQIDLKNKADPKYIYSTGDVTVHYLFDHSGSHTYPITVDGKLTILSPGTLDNDGVISGAGTVFANAYSGSGTLFGVTPTSSITGGTSIGGYTWNGSSSSAWNTTGNWISSVVPSLSTDDVVIPGGLGTYPSISTTGNNCRNILIESGGELTVDASSDITVSGTLTISSTSSGTGSLINNGTITGTVNVERYIAGWSDASHGWHLLSSPVASQAISVFHTAGSGNDFYSWDEVNDIWVNRTASGGGLNSGFETTFTNGKGYLIANSANSTKTFTGVPNVADVDYTNLSYTDGSTHTGWHLLGNPYPSNLNWNTTAWNLAGCNATAKIWKESTAAYVDIFAGSTDIIPAMQGFMVCMTGSTNTITIDASDRTHSSQNWYKSAEENKIKLTAYDPEGNTAQESIIKFNQNATTGFDSEFDSRFLSGYAPLFYTVINDAILSTNTLPEITAETTIPMSFIKNVLSNFYIEAEGVNDLNPHESVYLTDLKTNHTQLLNDNPIYHFTSEEGDITERFVIHFSPLGIDDFTLTQDINIFAANGKVEVRNNKPIDAVINIYNIAGQLLSSKQLDNQSSASVVINNYKGPAVVSVITNNNVINKKVIVW